LAHHLDAVQSLSVVAGGASVTPIDRSFEKAGAEVLFGNIESPLT
jgi:hypothetical protein